MKAKALLAGVGLLMLCAAPARAQSETPGDIGAVQRPWGDGPLPVGRAPEWSFSEGVGFTWNVNSGRSHEIGLYALPGLSFRLSSRFEYLVEAHICHFVSPGGYMIGVMPIGGRFYFGHGEPAIYATFGMGAGWTNLTRLDEIDQRFNFLLQTGVGLRNTLSNGRAWTVEVRWSHISNAGMSSPNLGHNQFVFLGGFRFR
ncbi:MAG TPA: acyloxyacyl hydrolase [Thermoanaerobaculia bacterium]